MVLDGPIRSSWLIMRQLMHGGCEKPTFLMFGVEATYLKHGVLRVYIQNNISCQGWLLLGCTRNSIRKTDVEENTKHSGTTQEGDNKMPCCWLPNICAAPCLSYPALAFVLTTGVLEKKVYLAVGCSARRVRARDAKIGTLGEGGPPGCSMRMRHINVGG